MTDALASPPAPPLTGRTRDGIAQRLAQDLPDGLVVNLGVGIPLAVPLLIPPDVEVVLHRERGAGPGPRPRRRRDLTDAGKPPITLMSGAAITDSAMSSTIIRGGHLDVTVLGACRCRPGVTSPTGTCRAGTPRWAGRWTSWPARRRSG